MRSKAEKTSDGRGRGSKIIYLFGALGGLNWGYDTGVVSAAILYINRDFDLSPVWSGWIVTALIAGAVIGAAFGGRLSDKYGRWKILMATAVVFCIAPIGMALAPTADILVLFRFVVGLGAGLAAVTLPVYLSEIAPARVRGSVTAFYALAIVTGQFMGFIVGVLLAPAESWRWMLGLSVVPSLMFLAGLFLIWETPRWLVKKHRVDEAHEILLYDRTEDEAHAELADIQRIERAEEEAGPQNLRMLLQPWVRPALIVGIGLAGLQQVMGINTIIYYTPTTLTNVGFTEYGAVVANLSIGVMNILAVLVAVRYADRWGRKPLLLTGAIGTMVSLGVLAVTNLLLPEPEGLGVVGIVTLVCMSLYIFLFQMSWGSIVWVMLGEIFPLGVRAAAMGLATVALWFANGIVSFAFPPLLAAVGVGWLFAGFAVICLGALMFTWKIVPETKGKSLEQIETEFRDTAGMPILPRNP